MKKDTFKNLLILILLLIIAGGGIFLYAHKRPQFIKPVEKRDVLSVSAEFPKLNNVEVTKSFIGRVAAVRSVNILPYLSGYIVQIPADSGQTVKQGDVIVVLKQDEYKTALTSAYAKILSCAADLENAQSQYNRLQKAGSKAVSQTELDNAKTALLNARSAFKQAEAEFETARINLNYTFVRAPFDGVLGNINVAVGDFASPSMSPALVRIVQYNPSRVIFSVTDKEFLQNRDLFADKVKIILSDGEMYPFSGKVIYTENALEKSTNTLAVYAEFENQNRILVPNAYVKVLLEHSYKNVFLLSKSLVHTKNNGHFVYVLKNKIITEKIIKVITEKDGNYVVENDFSPTEMLITQEVEPYLVGKEAELKQSKADEN